MIKQIFYVTAVIILMVIAFRLMKKVKDAPQQDPYKVQEIPEDPEEELASESDEPEYPEELVPEEKDETEK